MKQLSLPETAFAILSKEKDPLKFQELYAKLAAELEMSGGFQRGAVGNGHGGLRRKRAYESSGEGYTPDSTSAAMPACTRGLSSR